MKTYKQRCEAVSDKIQKLEVRRQMRRGIITTTCLCVVSLVISLVLFVPFSTEPPDVSEYAGSPYYSLIQKINELTYEKPRYKNRFHQLTSQLSNRVTEDFLNSGVDYAPMAPVEDAELVGSPEGDKHYGGSYVEVTDNQVAGVTESDIIKRSDRYIYYLHGNELRIYSIAGDASESVGFYQLTDEEYADGELIWYDGTEMYLSQDCKTILLIRNCNWKTQTNFGTHICVTSLDVSDVTNVVQKDQIYMSGSYLSSRMVDGDLLLMGKFFVRTNKDFSDESTFLPQIGREGSMQPIAAEDIYAPEELDSTRYTVVCKLNGDTMEILSSAAFLSYSEEMYVSRDVIYATHSFTDNSDNSRRSMTEITALRYSGEKLENLGTVKVAGTVKDQYSMDEYRGILRVVTSTSEMVTETQGEFSFAQFKRNVNLYCISLETMEVAATVEAFAPDGETAESVRFDGDVGYVCTAEVITLTDPVYFFDLRDIHNITWKDTGTIDGYSSSLVNFGNGYLLGIGFSGSFGLKIEVYEETADGVQSVCAYEREAGFSGVYKSYLIDRENQLVGLALQDYKSGEYRYVVLMFDGYELRELSSTPFDGDLGIARAFVAEGWLYILGGDLRTVKLW